VNGQDLWRGMNDIDEKFIQEAETAKLPAGGIWKKAGALAACLCLVILLAALLPEKPDGGPIQPPDYLASGGLENVQLPEAVTEGVPMEAEPPKVCENRPGAPLNYAFTARSIRTDGGREDTAYPFITVLRSRRELEDYCAAQQGLFDLGSGFMEACEAYDEAYFARQDLVLICLEETSGSISHRVTQVREDADGWCITVARQIPREGTDDMAQWHILLEIEMGKGIQPEDPVHLHLTKEET